MRLIDADAIGAELAIDWQKALVKAAVFDAPTIDPEMLPIVRQLREELARVTAERNELAALCGKLVVLCDPQKEWRQKLFRRLQGRMIGDYMGSGYPFVDVFNRIFEEFESTASDGAYQAVRKAVDAEVVNRNQEKRNAK